jgi:hypothetical protein
MNTATITLVIYFVGIAAVVDRPGGGKIAIFPNARHGAYKGVALMPHRAYLHLRGSDFVDDQGKHPDPTRYCTAVVGGTWDAGSGICSLELRGAKLWTQTSEELSQDATFKKIPRFGKLCGDAPSPKRVYTEGTDPDFVAARFDVTGGVLSGCNRKYGAFVTKLTIDSTFGVLVVEQGPKTLRIRLGDHASLSIENRAEPSGALHKAATVAASGCNEHGYEHFGLYHFMASGEIACDVRCPIEATGMPRCEIPGVVEPGIGLPSASGADCGNTTYP